jgi:hypothetical protein
MDLPSVDPFKPSPEELLWANAGLDNANTAATATIESFIAITSCCCTINKPCKEFWFPRPGQVETGRRPAPGRIASVKRQRDVVVGVLDASDEIGEMIGTGNSSDDACGDNAQRGGRIDREGRRRRGETRATLRREKQAVQRRKAVFLAITGLILGC